MEQCRSIGIIIVSITSVLNSNIILTNSKTRNSESNSIRTIFSNVLGQFHISAINLNGYNTSSIRNIDCYRNGLIITISDISRNNHNACIWVYISDIGLINMEQSTCITVVVIRIINVLNSHIILTSSKTRNNHINCRLIFTSECGSVYFSAVDFNYNSTAGIGYIYTNCNGLIIIISDIYSTYIYIGSRRINMEQCTYIIIVIIRIISILSSYIIFAYSKTRNSESDSSI